MASLPPRWALRLARLAALAFVLAWLLSATLKLWLPVWLPFAVALGLELHFLWRGLRSRPRPPLAGDSRLPDERDADLGWGPGRDLAGEPLAGYDEETAPAPPARRPSPRRSWLAFELVVGLSLLLALWLWLPPGGWTSLSPARQHGFSGRLSALASARAGHPAQVHCDTAYRHVGLAQDADGLAVVGGRDAYLTPQICYRLYRLSSGQVTPEPSSWALMVLGHESAHLAGIVSEAQAECAGIRAIEPLGVALGLKRDVARRLAELRLRENASDRAQQPAYRVHDCRLPAR